MARETFPKETKRDELPAPDAGYHWVKNAMYGTWIQEADGTPYSCSVASESYWCN